MGLEFLGLEREHELEARPAGLRGLVEEVAPVCEGVRARDRQAQPRPPPALPARPAPRELLDQHSQPAGLVGEGVAELDEALRLETLGQPIERLGEAVDRRDRGAELVRGERYERRLELVRLLERHARLVLAREQARTVERKA